MIMKPPLSISISIVLSTFNIYCNYSSKMFWMSRGLDPSRAPVPLTVESSKVDTVYIWKIRFLPQKTSSDPGIYYIYLQNV